MGDGTHIQSRFRARIYRDSFGRIRYESHGLTAKEKDAVDKPNMIQIFDPVAGFMYMLIPQTAIAYRHKINQSEADAKVNEQTQPAPPKASTPTQAPETEGEPIIEQLGSRLIEGLVATGIKITSTIPVGAEGNDRPIVVVGEVWDSTNMGVTLSQKQSDPRSAETEKRMINLKQVEPDPTLFQIPADYTIKDHD